MTLDEAIADPRISHHAVVRLNITGGKPIVEKNYPTTFQQQYADHQWHKIDPVLKHAIQSEDVVAWKDLSKTNPDAA